MRLWLLAIGSAHVGDDVRDLWHERSKASFVVAFLIHLPYKLIEYGAIWLIIGLGCYFAFAWKDTLDTETGKNDNRNDFIMFVACTGVTILPWVYAHSSKSVWLIPKASPRDSEIGEQQHFSSRANCDEGLQVRQCTCEHAAQENKNELSTSTGSTAFVDALQKAADMHKECADADLRVAEHYKTMIHGVVSSQP